MSAPLSDKDANATMMDAQTQAPSDDVSAKDANAKSMEYHRKILADKIAQQSADECVHLLTRAVPWLDIVAHH
jgi:hypothetical protein